MYHSLRYAVQPDRKQPWTGTAYLFCFRCPVYDGLYRALFRAGRNRNRTSFLCWEAFDADIEKRSCGFLHCLYLHRAAGPAHRKQLAPAVHKSGGGIIYFSGAFYRSSLSSGQKFSPFLCRIFRPHPWARWKMPFRLNWMPAAADRKQRRGTFPDEEQGTEPLCRFAPEAKTAPSSQSFWVWRQCC